MGDGNLHGRKGKSMTNINTNLVIVIRTLLVSLTSTLLILSECFAANINIPICSETISKPRSVAFEPLRPWTYPEIAFEKGQEGNVVYQFTIDVDATVVLKCMVVGTGSSDLDDAILSRYGGAKAILPRDYSFERDKDIVYQDAIVASYKREYRSRQVGNDIKSYDKMKPLFAPDPVYPGESLNKREEGTVEVIGQMNISGRVESVQITRSSGYPLLDGSAMAAMSFLQIPASNTSLRIKRVFTFKLR